MTRRYADEGAVVNTGLTPSTQGPIARGLRVGVVAEGIETSGHASKLVALGCASGQGYLYSRPVPPDELAALRGRALAAA